MSTQSELPHPINIHARLRALERTPQLSKDLNQKHGDGIALRRQINVSEILEKHLAETRNTVKSLSGQLPDLERGVKIHIEDACNSYSACLLHPILTELHKRLPIELRDKIYELLLDFTNSIAVPRYDKNYTNNTHLSVDLSVQPNHHGTYDLQRGSAALHPKGAIRDLIRHLRVFVRYEVPTTTTPGAPVTTANTTPVRPANNTQVSATDTDAGPWQAEQEPYVRFSSSLYGLHSIAYPSRKVRVDLCILGPRSTAEKGSLGHVTRNLFLATKPIFDSVTTAGREVIARLERDKVGLNGDVTDVIESLDSSDPPLFVASTETIPATASTKSRAGSIASSAPRLTVVTV